MAEAVHPLSRRPAASYGARPVGTSRPLRLFPVVALGLFLAPIAAGLIGTWLPAAGYLPGLDGPALPPAPWQSLWQAPGLASALTLTVTSGLVATVLSFGIVVLICAALHGTGLFRAACRGMAPLLAMPHAALAIGLAFLIAPSGWLARLVSPWASGWTSPPDVATVQDPLGLSLTLGLVLKEVPFLLLMVMGALGQTRAETMLAIARSLGYGPVSAWLKAVFPLIYPQIRLPVYAVLAFSLSVVDMALVLAPTNPSTLAVLVMRWFHDPDLSHRYMAAAGATLQFAIVLGAVVLWRISEIGLGRVGRLWIAAGKRGGGGRVLRPLAGLAVAGLYTLSGAALLGLALWSVAWRWRFPDALPEAWSLAVWGRRLEPLAHSVWTTVTIASAASVLALALVLGCLENEKRHGLRLTSRGLCLLYAPLLVPQIAFLFGVQVLAVRAGADGLWVSLVWAHLLFVLPYVFLALAEPYRALDDRYARAALSLGASPARIFWAVKLPMLVRPIGFALAIGFAVSVAQYLPTIFIGAGRFQTLTTEAVSLAAGADRRVVGVYAFLQALLPLLAFAAVLAVPARLRRDGRGGARTR